jgi:hypothetical protein
MLNTIGEFWNSPLLLAQIGDTFSIIGAILIASEIFRIERIKDKIRSVLIFVRVTSIFFIKDRVLENPRLKIVRIIIVSYTFLIVSYLVVFVFKIEKNPELITFLIVLALLLLI